MKEELDTRKTLQLLKEPLQGQKTSSLILQAVQFIKEFEESKIELVPAKRGNIFAMSIFKNKNVTGGPDQRYILLDPILGELAIF